MEIKKVDVVKNGMDVVAENVTTCAIDQLVEGDTVFVDGYPHLLGEDARYDAYDGYVACDMTTGGALVLENADEAGTQDAFAYMLAK